MRREWAATIKNRRWGEFEQLAKTEPDQLLCDTIAELERGFSEKSDRKALKKVLWILGKAGFEPAPFEDQPEPESQSAPPSVAFMISADGRGDVPITFGHWHGDRYRWLTTYINELRGVVRASDESMSADDADRRIRVLRISHAPPFVSAEVDPNMAAWRIRRALVKNGPGTLPECIARWRTLLDKAEEVAHPSLSLQGTAMTAKERSEDVLLRESTYGWRIELGAATPILDRMYEAQQATKEQGEEAQKAALKVAGDEARKFVVTEKVIADHVMRLRDLAWLMHLNGQPEFGQILAAAEELESKGADSEYAKVLVDKTIVVYFEMMRDKGELEEANRDR